MTERPIAAASNQGEGFLPCLLVLAAALATGEAFPAKSCQDWVAKVVEVQGNVEVRPSDDASWQALQMDQSLCGGAIVRVLEHGRAALRLRQDATDVQLDQDTSFILPPPPDQNAHWVDLLKGAAHFLSRTPTALKIRTPFLNAHIEGTEFMVRSGQRQSDVLVFNGRVLAENALGKVSLEGGQKAVAVEGQAPRRYLLLHPRDAVSWALYYPPLIDWHVVVADKSLPVALSEAARLYEVGRVDQALASLELIPAAQRDSRFLAIQAGLLLSVGRSDEALPAIEAALANNPNDADALALKAVVTLTQGNKLEAERLARRAIQIEPQFAVPRVALSYVQQSQFKLDDALLSLEMARRLSPRNALVLARLAELELSRGELETAVKYAEQAVEINPDHSRTQTILGFAHLIQLSTDNAMHAFRDAIRLDSSDPLPRLGSGLALIRAGELDEGVKSIEIAATLDPTNSLVRSYLGKGYYEQKRGKLAATEYDIAKSLDPMDPTPWFYGAIQKQTQNEPVAALRDLEAAKQRNQSRAVYRSRLMLDQDAAARSASLGRIYSDLGFGQLALVEGWRSVATDPADFSSHRFLADIWSNLPRHEIARASDLLQSQLLQPMNTGPISPELPVFSQRLSSRDSGDNPNFLVLSGSGPARATFNEFNPLFSRNGNRFFGSGAYGDNGIIRDEAVIYGVRNSLSYSIGQAYYETNGYRKNNDLTQDLYHAFVQWNPTPAVSVQSEFRYLDAEHGHLQRRFDITNFRDKVRRERYGAVGRVGLRYSPEPGSDFLASFVTKGFTLDTTDVIFKKARETTADEKSYLLETQYVWQRNEFKVITGYSHYDGRTAILRPNFFSPSRIKDDTESSQDTIYSYTQVRPVRELWLTLGISVDLFNSSRLANDGFIAEYKQDRVNPKFGTLWNLTPNTTFRLAAFRVQKRNLPSNQTLEPIQLAGFNQFFDDLPATSAWRYGFGLDHRFSSRVHGGAELTRRNLDLFDLEGDKANWREKLGRAYVYWTPREWLALSAEYSYEFLDRELSNFSQSFTRIRTHRVPIGATFIHPSGVTLGVSATYQAQAIEDTEKVDFASGAKSGTSNFWMLAARVSYRLPNRWGMISLVVDNLLDQRFSFQETDFVKPWLAPERQIYGTVTVTF